MRRVDVLLAGNLCRMNGGRAAARAGGIGVLENPGPYWEQLRTVLNITAWTPFCFLCVGLISEN